MTSCTFLKRQVAGLKAPAQPSRGVLTYIVYSLNIVLGGDFYNFNLKSSHGLKTINGTLIITANSDS